MICKTSKSRGEITLNKTALKKFAIEARNDLRDKVKTKAFQYGITEKSINDKNTVPSNDFFKDGKNALTREEKDQRNKVLSLMEEKGFNQVIEEVAYTWFNRFTALRFMEIHNYLPSKVRVLSSINEGSVEPDIIREALNVDLNVDKETVYNLKMSTENDATDKLYKYLIMAQCDALSITLPFLFGKTDDYTKLLFPDGLLSEGSFLRKMSNTEVLPESDWDQVEIIGWLYQYYIAEENERVIKAKKRYKKEEIPFATQLFTPDWIVRYMVQNALGRYWVESHPEDRDLIKNWEFYLENPNPEPDFEEKLAPYLNKNMKVEEIKCFDPAMGSGHILVYMFDVLYEIYLKCGYMEREIPKLIIENNLYGLDIDDRAYQLACFCVIMKAQQYNNRFLRNLERQVRETGEYIKLNLASIQETNGFDVADIEYIAGEASGEKFNKVKRFVEQFENAKIYGSLIEVVEFDEKFLRFRAKEIIKNPVEDIALQNAKRKVDAILDSLILQSKIMIQIYDVLVTNPPYIGNRNSNTELRDFLSIKYPNEKSDIFASFMKFGFFKVNKKGHIGMMTPNVWMFISSYQSIREFIIDYKNISSLVQLSTSGFTDATVSIVATTFRNYKNNIAGHFIRLEDFSGTDIQEIKTKEAVANKDVNFRFEFFTTNFSKIYGSPIAYWIPQEIVKIYEKNVYLEDVADIKPGIKTGKNEMFLRLWHEVPLPKIGFNMTKSEDILACGCKWFPYNKGGAFRKWYGNREYVINFEHDARDIKLLNNDYRLREPEYYFKQSITWTFISSSKFGVRYSTKGFLFDLSGSSLFPKEEDLNYILGFLCTELTFQLLKIQNPTLNFQVENIKRLPFVKPEKDVKDIISRLVSENIKLSMNDWDCFETSWDFKRHPFQRNVTESIEISFKNWDIEAEKNFKKLKCNEEELNCIFNKLYGLDSEVLTEVADNDITINRADREREIKSFISYTVGCMFGRYSLDEEGLIFAGGEFDPSHYKTFPADKDNVLPIVSDTYFEDDIVARFIEFVEVTFSKETLDENLNYIAETLGKKAGETDKETIRRYFLNDFYKDHVQTYKKRPIYWMITSGKSKAFNALIYMHRYDKTTLSRVRTDYLHVLQTRLNAQREKLLSIINGNESEKEKSKAKKELKTIEKQIEELKDFDEVLHHMADKQIEIDLDDGVAVNYMKFKELLVDIKLKNSEEE